MKSNHKSSKAASRQDFDAELFVKRWIWINYLPVYEPELSEKTSVRDREDGDISSKCVEKKTKVSQD